jgi:hypothetical protein
MARAKAVKVDPKFVVTPEERTAGIVEKLFHDPDQDVLIVRVEWDKVKLDNSYGRDHDQRHSNRLANREPRFRPYPVLSYRDSTLYVPDGNHRKEAEKKRKKANGLAILVPGLTVQQEGQLYDDLNTVKNQNLWQRVKAGRVGGNRFYIEMMDTVEEYDFTHQLNSKWGMAELRSASVILEAARAEILKDWLTLLAAFRDTDQYLAKPVRDNIEFQRGVVDVLKRFGTRINITKAARALKKVTARYIDQLAEEYCNCARTNRRHFAAALTDVLGNHNAIANYRDRIAA